jgi:hypothetical protein
MSGKSMLKMALMVVLMGLLVTSIRSQKSDALSATIYIRADGSVEGTANIASADNVTYLFADDINGSVVVERSGITIDGNSHVVQGDITGNGLTLSHVHNVTVKNMEIRSFYNCIWLNCSSGITLVGNNIEGAYNDILETESNNNVVIGNNITNAVTSIRLEQSNASTIFHNNFMYQDGEEIINSSASSWDNGIEGNYWTDYFSKDNVTDLYSGPYQNETGSDGIGDTPYPLQGVFTGDRPYDNYPLMGMFSDFNATPENNIQTVCNSSISNFQFSDTAVRFNVSGENGTDGFCRIRIPTALMNGSYRVFVGGTEVSYNLLPCSNETYSCLYFSYTHSTQEVIVTPEFPTFLILPLFMTATLLAVVVCRRKRPSSFGR